MLTLGLAGGLDPVHEARLDTPESGDAARQVDDAPLPVPSPLPRLGRGPERMAAICQIRTTYDANPGVPLSRPLYELLMGLEGEKALSELLATSGDAAAEEALLSELDKLWSQRLVRLRGGESAAAG